MKSSVAQIEAYYRAWQRALNQLVKDGLAACLEEDIYLIGPNASQMASQRVKLTICVTLHGNEVAGIAALSQFVDMVAARLVTLPFVVGVTIGNLPAARRGERFLERDLNRSFGSTSFTLQEQRRAKVLQDTLLDRTDFLLDIHQTRLANQTPFTIFPYTAQSLAFAALVCPGQPVVTHWGPSFSKEGLCSDEYVQVQGGQGITVETGQAGFDPTQVSFGFSSMLRAICVLERGEIGSAFGVTELAAVLQATQTQVFSWAQVVEFPEHRDILLKPGLMNFSPVAAGEQLGVLAGEAFYAQQAGAALFPIYPEQNSKTYHKPPREIIRLVKPITIAQLPV
ncbi:MAG: succinylglutamate desuccinylase/aspartoacylase family protein [Zetaproteobacteria bacterium]|nr:succinylglutamate desuccinylase/aspartoacylase family protein [Zetaproteobacteria bacterium]